MLQVIRCTAILNMCDIKMEIINWLWFMCYEITFAVNLLLLFICHLWHLYWICTQVFSYRHNSNSWLLFKVNFVKYSLTSINDKQKHFKSYRIIYESALLKYHFVSNKFISHWHPFQMSRCSTVTWIHWNLVISTTRKQFGFGCIYHILG